MGQVYLLFFSDNLIKPFGLGFSGASPIDISGGDFSQAFLETKTNFAKGMRDTLHHLQNPKLFHCFELNQKTFYQLITLHLLCIQTNIYCLYLDLHQSKNLQNILLFLLLIYNLRFNFSFFILLFISSKLKSQSLFHIPSFFALSISK